MKAYPIIWNNPQRYSKHIVLIGTVHLVCAYLKMVGKKMAGTGFNDVLIEVGLITCGSLKGVMSGKNYGRSIHCHKIVLEALERLLFEKFTSSRNEDTLCTDISEISRAKIHDLVENLCEEFLDNALNDEEIVSYLMDFHTFASSVRTGALGKTAQLWISYTDHIWLVLSLIMAVKSNDFKLYKCCLFKMCDLFLHSTDKIMQDTSHSFQLTWQISKRAILAQKSC